MSISRKIPKKVYYCKRHNTVKDRMQECPWYYANGKCMAASANGVSPDGCSAIELVTMPKEISAVLVNEIDFLLAKYDNADPPMDRTKFAVALIEKVKEGYKDD